MDVSETNPGAALPGSFFIDESTKTLAQQSAAADAKAFVSI